MKTFHTPTDFFSQTSSQTSSQTRSSNGQLTSTDASGDESRFRAQAGRVPASSGRLPNVNASGGHLRRGVLLAGIACATLGVAGCVADSANSATPAPSGASGTKVPVSQMSHHPRWSSAAKKAAAAPAAAEDAAQTTRRERRAQHLQGSAPTPPSPAARPPV